MGDLCNSDIFSYSGSLFASNCTDVFPYQGYIQIYFSGPILFLLGLFLFFYFKKRIPGLMFIIFSIILLSAITYELLTK